MPRSFRPARSSRPAPTVRPARTGHAGRAGQHELGQNFLRHRPTLRLLTDLVCATSGSILEIGPGDGALTAGLSRLGRAVLAVELDHHHVNALRRRFPSVQVIHADALSVRFDRDVVVGNLPFHLTTALLRKLLRSPGWQQAVLVLLWEVARKRAGVGGRTMMTAQAAPWFEFTLYGRVPAHGFSPAPSVDAGVLGIDRRRAPMLPLSERRAYERFVAAVFTGRGAGVRAILSRLTSSRAAQRAVQQVGIDRHAHPRDLTPQQWVGVWQVVGERR